MAIAYTGRLAQEGEIHSSNDVAINICEESSPGTLPDAGSQYWLGLEINSFSTFGGQTETIRRRYFERRRQLGKARVQSIRAEAGWQADITDAQYGRISRSFLFSDDGATANQPVGAKPDTQSIYTHKKTNIGAITTTDIPITNTAAGLGVRPFIQNNIVLITGGKNNGAIKTLSSVDATKLVTSGLTADTAKSASAPNVPETRVQAIGYQFAAGTAEMQVVGGKARLNRKSGTVDWTTLGLSVGEWIFIGGDDTAYKFDTPPQGKKPTNGFARISSVSASGFDLDDTTFVPEVDAGAGKTIQIFFGSFLHNGNTKRTFTVERILGQDASSNETADYVIGALPNEMTINFEAESIVNADYTFVPLDSFTVDFGDTICSQETGVFRVPRTGVGGFATQVDVYRVKLQLKDTVDDLFAFVNSGSVAITNNVEGQTALGYRSYIGQNVGSFEGSGSVEALFQNVKAIAAIHDNKSLFFNIISVAKDTRQGLVLDLPEVTVAGQPGVELDTNITLPLDLSAAEDPVLNYTTSVTLMPHVPVLADSL